MADQWPRWWEIMTEGLGAKLREVRTAKGMSLRSLAQALGVSASLISQVEIGKTQPSVSTLFAMANHLGVSLDELVGNAQRVVSGVEPQDLRDSQALRQTLSTQMAAVQAGLDQLLVDRPRRNIQRRPR